MSSGTSALSPFNTEQRRPTLATFRKTRIQKTSFKYWHPRVACRCHLRYSTLVSSLVFTLRNIFNLHLADPKVDDFPISIQSAILYALLKLMLCFRSAMLVRSFTVNKISGTRCTRHAVFLYSFDYCQLLELYVNCAALYRTFIPQSFWNTRCGRLRGRKFHLTRSLVALEGWSSVRDHTNRNHCPPHKIWSYNGDGRWWGWSFDRGSTV